ncbi:ABC transporter permease subunit [Paenibacillus sp. MMS20-IR301]|uniref:ABC transporter permease subunit n=1 Tax=Paenibacillus sp. MMS20-IR301 TaxID=2895946 RepID=UPI0028E2B0EB|nr:ABC transporter permease subunit [Paenibacillus sp. MMS20-IR301]WNS43007.1 ABC transporter permease subunit [Paenibacillus sp. MMS20-IR301]
MKKLRVLYAREMLEAARSYKLIWIPVVFIILGIMQPLVTFYMPDILAASSNVPAGFLESYEMPGANAVMAEALGQYGTIGMLILALGAMNSLAGERAAGTAELLMAKPVSPAAVVAAKWAANLTVLIVALGLGAAGAAYYTVQLMGALSWSAAAVSSGIYALWLLCTVSLTLLFSAWLRGPAAACLALLLAAGMSLGYSLLPDWLGWTPAALPAVSAGILNDSGPAGGAPVISAVVLIILCIAGASLLAGRNKLPD